jgi:short-subunit dehydrogenase
MRSVVITGVSSGIGYAGAAELCRRGYREFGSVRNADQTERLQHEWGAAFTPLLFDVTDAEAVKAAAAQVRSALDGGLTALSTMPAFRCPRSAERAVAGHRPAAVRGQRYRRAARGAGGPAAAAPDERRTVAKFLWMSADIVAEVSLRDLGSAKFECIPGALNRCIAFMLRNRLYSSRLLQRWVV